VPTRCSAIAQDEIESAESESVHKGQLLQGRYPSQCDSIPLNHVCRSRSDIATAASPLCRRNSSPCAGLEPAANLTSVYNTDPRLAKFLKSLTIQGGACHGILLISCRVKYHQMFGIKSHQYREYTAALTHLPNIYMLHSFTVA